MKFNIKQFLKEEDSGVAGGYIGYASDAESFVQTPYQGISDPKNSMGAFGTVHQNQTAFKPLKTIDQQQLDQLQASIFGYLSGEFLDPRQALYNVKVKLNHLGLDFDFNKNIELNPGRISFKLSRFGEKFGTTPTTDLSKGFDRGTDYTDSVFSFTLMKYPSGKYCFKNITIGEQSPEIMQAESFYSQIASNNELYENIIKPILLNLLEKAQNKTLTEDTIERQLSFIVERSSKKLNIELNESDIDNLTKGLYKILFEETEGSKSAEGSMDRINAMAKASGKDVAKIRRERRARAIQRMKQVDKK